MRVVRLAVCAVVIAAVLGACDLLPLFSLVGRAFPSASPEPTVVPMQPGHYTHGTATIAITSGEPRTVDLRIDPADIPGMFEGLGASILWRGEGWALHIVGGGAGGLKVHGAGITLYRGDTVPPLSAEGASCTITYTAGTDSHFAGHAECANLAWIEARGNPMDLPIPTGSPVPDHPRFDATITFDATP